MRLVIVTVTSTTRTCRVVEEVLRPFADHMRVEYNRDDRKYHATLKQGTKARALATRLKCFRGVSAEVVDIDH
jgi:hypothetical protein